MSNACQYTPALRRGVPFRGTCSRAASHTTTWKREKVDFVDLVLCGPHAAAEDRCCVALGESKTTERIVPCDRCERPNDRAAEGNYCTSCAADFHKRTAQEAEQRPGRDWRKAVR